MGEVMAKKTILYEVKIRNGHGVSTEYHVGQTKALIKKDIETPDVKVESVKSLGQKEVSVGPDDNYHLAEFNVCVDDNSGFTFDRNSRGYQYLRNKFQPQVDKLESEMNSPYEP